jgi:hypothetical protein
MLIGVVWEIITRSRNQREPKESSYLYTVYKTILLYTLKNNINLVKNIMFITSSLTLTGTIEGG